MNIINAYLTKNPCYQANVNKQDSRYTVFQERGPVGLMLHSVGCNQPSAEVFVNNWNKESYDRACVHAFIDANTGDVWQTLPWNFRGWHCGSGSAGSANNTHVGVEMCESRYINYINGYQFTVSNTELAKADAKRAYDSAVQLFAYLCNLYNLDPNTAIISHKEGAAAHVASDHGDPEHYWKGLGMPYTMKGFRADVKAAIGGQPQPEPEPTPGGGGYLGFPDVSKDDWFADALKWAVDKNIILASGKPFYPDKALDKATFVVLLRRAYNALHRDLLDQSGS